MSVINRTDSADLVPGLITRYKVRAALESDEAKAWSIKKKGSLADQASAIVKLAKQQIGATANLEETISRITSYTYTWISDKDKKKLTEWLTVHIKQEKDLFLQTKWGTGPTPGHQRDLLALWEQLMNRLRVNDTESLKPDVNDSLEKIDEKLESLAQAATTKYEALDTEKEHLKRQLNTLNHEVDYNKQKDELIERFFLRYFPFFRSHNNPLARIAQIEGRIRQIDTSKSLLHDIAEREHETHFIRPLLYTPRSSMGTSVGEGETPRQVVRFIET